MDVDVSLFSAGARQTGVELHKANKRSIQINTRLEAVNLINLVPELTVNYLNLLNTGSTRLGLEHSDWDSVHDWMDQPNPDQT